MSLNYTAPSFVGGLPTAMALTQAFADIEAALGRAVSIDGVAPNAMEEDFDLNGHSLLNVGNVDDLFSSTDTTALATRLTAVELELDLSQVSQAEQDAAILTNSNNITSNDTDIASLLSEVTALVLSQATQDLLLQSHTTDLVTINTRAQSALDKSATNEADLLSLGARVNTIDLSQVQQDTSLTDLLARLVVLEGTTVTPPTTTGQMTFAEISAGAESWMDVQDEYDYVGEYLRQNPTTCFWEYDAVNSLVKTLSDPAPLHPTVVTAPAPVGGGSDDTAALQSAIDALPAGGTLVPDGGPYYINSVNLIKSIRLSGFDFRPTNLQTQEFFFVQADDVQIFDCELDGITRDVTFGCRVETGSDRFMFVRSSCKNYVNSGASGWAQGAGISMRGNTDMYIACSTFSNLSGTQSTGGAGGVRAVMVNGRSTETVSGGVFISNTCTELQSQAQNNDADVFVLQDIAGNQVVGTPLFTAANVCVDAGGRFLKAQSGGVQTRSESYTWSTSTGPVGTRKLKAFFDTQNSSDNTAKNNFITNSAGRTIGGLLSIITNATTVDNVHYDNNFMTWNIAAASGAFDYVVFYSGATNASNSSVSNNIIGGTGSADMIHAYYVDTTAGVVDVSGNAVSITYGALETVL